MKILFISTDEDFWTLGLRSVSAVVKEKGHETSLLFLPENKKRYSQKTLNALQDFVHAADVVGFSCLARGSDKVKQVSEALRPLKKLTIWGGVHASLNPADCAHWVDIVCRGEGEEVMLELLERLEKGQDWKDIQNIAYNENGVFTMNNSRPPLKDLDSLPLPDFSFDSEYHLKSDEFVRAFTLPDVTERKSIYFNGSRGCAFYCTYCCNQKLKDIYSRKDQYVRRMSVPRLIEHAKNLKNIFPQGKYFYFLDEDFAARPQNEILQFSEEYPKQVGLPFECLVHPARVTTNKMDLLVKAGLWRINMGMESGSERTRKEVYDRHVSQLAIQRAAEIISCYPQVVPYYFFIISNPFEERNDLLDTANLIGRLPLGCHIIVYNMVFFPGSALYERAVQHNIIAGDQDSGVDLDYLSGFNYSRHSWKAKNFFLNGLLFMMGGLSSRLLLGLLPRSMLGFLLNPNVIDFGEKHPAGIRFLISLKSFADRLRHLLARLVKKVIRNPMAVYNPIYHLRKSLRHARQFNIN